MAGAEGWGECDLSGEAEKRGRVHILAVRRSAEARRKYFTEVAP